MSDHNHSHGSGGGCCHSNDDHTDPNNLGLLYSLYSKIDINNLTTLNESEENSGRTVFRSWDDRLSKDHFVISDCDDELLFNIPFTGNVKLKGIIVMGGEDESHPARVRLYKNKGHMSFDDVKCEADQEFELTRDTTGTMEYPVKIVKFSSVYNLSLHFPKSIGGDVTKIYYIGLRGEFTEGQREKIVLASYELAANPADNHVKSDKKVNYEIF